MKITLLVTLLFGLIFVTAVNAAEKKRPRPSSKKNDDLQQRGLVEIAERG